MKIRFDSNGFIWELYDERTKATQNTVSDTLQADVEYDFDVIVDTEYAVPFYRYLNNTVYKITDPEEYKVDSDLWLSYLDKLNAEVQFMLKTKTDDEMKALYESAPDYLKTAIYYGIELKWAGYISQYRFNLAIEMVTRTIAEYLYIKEVEKREFTADELAGINKMLTMIHNHSATVEFPIKETGWYHGFVNSMLEDSDYARYQCIPQRLYITGRT